jgi:hypothetical protein
MLTEFGVVAMIRMSFGFDASECCDSSFIRVSAGTAAARAA